MRIAPKESVAFSALLPDRMLSRNIVAQRSARRGKVARY